MNGDETILPQGIDWRPLLGPVPPWGHFLACSEREMDDAIRAFRECSPEQGNVAVCVTHGDHCRTRTRLFDEWAAAMRFPSYFGHNWGALHDCIRDMMWLPAQSYIFVIAGADRLLDEDEAALPILIDLFASSADEWADYVEGGPQWPRNALFHVLFQCDPAVADETKQRLEGAGAHLEEVRFIDD